MSNNSRLRLVVIPSDPIVAYEKKGLDWLEAYYNPQKMFQEVFALSPLEEGERKAYGMTILGVPEKDFSIVLRRIHPDVVRAYGGYWPADLACHNRLADVPVVVSIHDTNPSLLHRSVRYADLVICLSTVVQKKVIAMGTDPARTRVMPNRIDTSIFQPVCDKAVFQSFTERFPPGKHILHIGRKAYEKNIDTLIRALEVLPPEYSCIFIGQGNNAPYLELAEQLAMSKRCFWIESVKNSELPVWYSWCDCFCVPSRWEGFGLVFIEAAACGAAIVTSDIAPMTEYFANDRSAFLVRDYENPTALANAIHKVCEDANYRQRIATGAIKVAQPFDRRIVDAKEVEIYREALLLGPLSAARRMQLALWNTREFANHFVGQGVPQKIVQTLKRRFFSV